MCTLVLVIIQSSESLIKKINIKNMVGNKRHPWYALICLIKLNDHVMVRDVIEKRKKTHNLKI